MCKRLFNRVWQAEHRTGWWRDIAD